MICCPNYKSFAEGNTMFKSYFMMRKLHVLALTSIVITLLLAACAGGTTSTTSSTPTPTQASISAIGHGVLKHVPYGRAELLWNPASKTLTVKMSLTGLVPHSVHPAHIHGGNCNIPGRLIYPLQYVIADATGNATVTSTVNNIADGIPATGWMIYVHNGPYVTSDAQSLPITCGDIVNPTSAKSVAVNMSSAIVERDQSVNGAVQLTLRGEQLMVNLRLTGLQPGSTHPAQIYAGSCSKQGNVVHQLPNVVADAKGSVNLTTVINNVSSIPSSGWYVNVHYSTDLTTQAGADAIVCGDVITG
jgi:Cu/Zn superoxide dismutase